MCNFSPHIQETTLQRHFLEDKSKHKISKNDLTHKWRKLAHR